MSTSSDVYLYIYDLTGGLASRLSVPLIGCQIKGIWHTGVVAYGREYFFGSGGIGVADPPCSLHGDPYQKKKLGKTEIPLDFLEQYIHELNEGPYRGETYHLLNHNCNHFSDELCTFLVGSGVPKEILDQADKILNTPFGQTFRGVIEQLSHNSPEFALYPPSAQHPHHHPSNFDFQPFRPLSAVYSSAQGVAMSEENGTGEVVEVSATRIAEELAEEERREREERRKNREPPIVFKDAVDVHIEFDALVGLIDGKMNEEEQLALEELHQYMLQDEGSWALGDGFLLFIGRLLSDASLGPDVSVRCLNVLAAAALKDDVILLLHQDRKQHVLMNYAFEVDRLALPQQRSLTLFMCNLFESTSSAEWMLYISEWQYNNSQISNIRVTTKVTVNAMLSDDTDLQDRGTAILYNLATKEVKSVVFDDIAVELTMAILQFLGGSPVEAHVFRCLKALAKFCQISSQDVPQLVHMIGPHPSKFKGQSERNDKLIEEISRKIK